MLKKFVDQLPIMPIAKPLASSMVGDYYEITMMESFVKLHRDLPPTKIWGYNGQFPGPTFIVRKHRPIRVLWKNNLPTKHFLPIDPTVHGAEKDKPEVRTVVHLHGGVTPDHSDGYPEAWYTKDFEQTGPYFTNYYYDYPNIQSACTLWYHDHAMGITRLNIYAGLAGLYILQDEEEWILPLPKGEFDLPLLLQDRSVTESGELYYPRQPTPPVNGVDPSVLADFFGEYILVNGKIWPFLEVEPRRYRFRILNGSNARFYNMTLSSDVPFIQIGSDQGLLESPVTLNELLLAPAERADVIIDFSTSKEMNITLMNSANSPYPQGDPPNPETEGIIMQFRIVKPLSDKDNTRIPAYLSYVPRMKERPYEHNRTLLLDMVKDSFNRTIHLLDGKMWSDPITEMPRLWGIEVWNIVNTTRATHPIHLHLVRFQVLDRQRFDKEQFDSKKTIVPLGPRSLPDLNERGWKDTVRANPSEITRIIIPFGPFTGLFVWHCHILEHEDYEMMRPYIVIKE